MKIKDLIEHSTAFEDQSLHEEQAWFVSEPCVDPDISLEDRMLHEEVINMYEMANLSSKTTGIDGVIVWVSGGFDKLKHCPRIKVVKGTKYRTDLSSTIPIVGVPRIIGNADLTQDDFANIVSWIDINRNALLSYGNDEITTDQLLTQLRKI